MFVVVADCKLVTLRDPVGKIVPQYMIRSTSFTGRIFNDLTGNINNATKFKSLKEANEHVELSKKMPQIPGTFNNFRAVEV